MADTNSKVLKIQIDKKRHSFIGRTREPKAPILATEIRALKRSNSLNFISSATQNKKLNKFINPSETPRWEQLYELHDKKSRKFLEKKKIILKNQDLKDDEINQECTFKPKTNSNYKSTGHLFERAKEWQSKKEQSKFKFH